MATVSVKFWGVRGSMASPGRGTAVFGGNTSCVELSSGKDLIICDAGTGIRPLGLDLVRRYGKKPVSAHILLSHLHWDHYIGLPFFRAFYSSRNSFVIAGPKPTGTDFGSALLKVTRPPYFPVPLSSMPARIKLKTLALKPFKIGRVRIVPFAVNHPGNSFGWRFFFPNGKSLVYITDNEPVTGAGLQKFIKWMEGADVLIHDSQYGPDNYEAHKGWGHSPFTYPIELAKMAGIKRLFLFHFDPGDDDRHMRKVLTEARRMIFSSGANVRCELAREGFSFNL